MMVVQHQPQTGGSEYCEMLTPYNRNQQALEPLGLAQFQLT